MRCFPDTPFFMTDTKNTEQVSLESSENLLCCLSDQSCWPIDLHVCQPAQARSGRSH